MTFEIMDLDESDLNHINETKGLCPKCKDGELKGGPCGGSSQNFRCEECGQEFYLGVNRWGNPFIWMGGLLNRKDKCLYNKEFLSKRWGKV